MKRNGFTIMELAISLSIFGILALVAAGIINIGIKSYDLFLTRATFAREAQNTLRVMQEKIPQAIPIEIIQAKKRRFRFNTMTGQEVDFQYVNNNSLMRYRIVGEHGWRTILNNIAKNGVNINYYKGDGNKAKKSEDIRRIVLTIKLEKEDQSAEYTYKFFIRNQ
jgi:prepilin-type N-terminal cleavage/methylation domain-containing protein